MNDDIHADDTRPSSVPQRVRQWLLNWKLQLSLLAGGVFLLIVAYALLIHHPSDFPRSYTFSIPEGSSITAVAEKLHSEDLIRSPSAFKLLAVALQDRAGIYAGDYFFTEPEDAIDIAKRTTKGEHGLTPQTVIIPEGATIFDIAERFGAQFVNFQRERFVELALEEDVEGYLFPDTYQFLPTVTEERVLTVMRRTFDERIATIKEEIERSNIPLRDVIIMASLIEKESGNDFEERRTIAGILWNRLSIGMALQVDAVFPYINGKNTYQLTLDDLAIESPYNTYLNPGLPIGPIANPGLDSILAAVDPKDTNYLYYLHDNTGQIHYSTDFDGHRENKFRYLR